MRLPTTFTVLCFTLLVAAACDDAIQAPKPAAPPVAIDPNIISHVNSEALSGGATTVFDTTAGAFGHPAPNLDAASLARHVRGDSLFSMTFVATAGSTVSLPDGSVVSNSGLGPLFNNTACEACHVGDGLGRPPNPGEQFESMLFRASIPGTGPNGGPNPAGLFGGQLQLQAIPGFTPEASASVTYVDSGGRYADGTTYSLRVPRYSFAGIIAPLPSNLLTSPRVAPFNFGLGLLEAVPASTIQGFAEMQAFDRDGVSGHPNRVFDVPLQQYVIGRFGWKANVGTLLHQAAGAFNGDMGITSSYFPQENCVGEFPGCADHAAEISNQTAADVAFYTQTLGVPARRHLGDPQVERGEFLFSAIGCNACHVTTMQTGVLAGVPAVSNQRIHPYTDLLVHDMGPALADNRPDFQAGGREFRTPPLWGIGLVHTVNGHTFFLHDGRARNLLEAVLWHGGEATRSRQRFTSLSAEARAALIAFLNSL